LGDIVQTDSICWMQWILIGSTNNKRDCI